MRQGYMHTVCSEFTVSSYQVSSALLNWFKLVYEPFGQNHMHSTLDFCPRLRPCNPAVTYAAFQHQGRLFWITCKRLKLLKKAGRLQLIQNSTLSVTRRQQCCIRIGYHHSDSTVYRKVCALFAWVLFLDWIWLNLVIVTYFTFRHATAGLFFLLLHSYVYTHT